MLGIVKLLRRLLGVLFLASGSLQAASLQAELVDGQGQPLANAVLTLQSETVAGPPADQDVMDQRDKQFAPYVLAVRTGTPVSFPNSDNIRHQVYSFSPAKHFELRLYKGTPSQPVVFDKPGVVVLGCNIHDWMLGYVYVTDDPWYAVSDAGGRLRLNLPPGRYRVSLWHPQVANLLPVTVGDLQVPAAGLQQRLALSLQAPAAKQPHEPEEYEYEHGEDHDEEHGESAHETEK
ncbi:methylamine utilization protein [Pseudomonas cavernae]|uniref:methylamine utilization protein n=1 Tax=Pseudomonas cavernae TaxID=2320867 RepID=UPI001EE51D87|nr:methylamine utilization protein [Pseudomonas cavernae]